MAVLFRIIPVVKTYRMTYVDILWWECLFYLQIKIYILKKSIFLMLVLLLMIHNHQVHHREDVFCSRLFMFSQHFISRRFASTSIMSAPGSLQAHLV